MQQRSLSTGRLTVAVADNRRLHIAHIVDAGIVQCMTCYKCILLGQSKQNNTCFACKLRIFRRLLGATPKELRHTDTAHVRVVHGDVGVTFVGVALL